MTLRLHIMKPVLLMLIGVFLINTKVNAQYLKTEKIVFYASSLAYCFLEGYTEAYMTLEKHESNPAQRLSYNQTWHQLKTFREVSTIGTGIAISLDSKFKPWQTLSNLFVTASLYWLIHDEVINRVNGWKNIPFGYTSKSNGGSFNNGSFFDGFANPYMKILSLLLSVTLNILISD